MIRNCNILSFFSLNFLAVFLFPVHSVVQNQITLQWLGDEAPSISTGVSWGVPWPRSVFTIREDFNFTHRAERFPRSDNAEIWQKNGFAKPSMNTRLKNK